VPLLVRVVPFVGPLAFDEHAHKYLVTQIRLR
jgi:hypothetical protein